MSSRNRKPCNYFSSPQGCRRGASCTFAHSLAPEGSSTPQVSGGSRVAPTRSENSDVPNGNCNFYWKTGNCSREFNCRYKHVAGPTVDVAKPIQGLNTAVVAPFLTAAGLAKLNGAGTDALFSISTPLSPGEVQAQLRRFTPENFKFRHSLDIEAFLKLLGNASSSNPSWTSEDGQLLLQYIASKSGLARISEILDWDRVSSRAGTNRLLLSFQRGYVPLLRYLSSDFVIKSTLNQFVNALYACIGEHFEKFARNTDSCMTEIMRTGSFNDVTYPNSAEVLGSQVLASLAIVLFEYLTRFKNSVAKEPLLPRLASSLQEWVSAWAERVASNPPTFDDPLRSTSAEARDHIIQSVTSKVDRVVAIVDRETDKVNRSNSRQRLMFAQNTGRAQLGLMAALENAYEGPGFFRRDGPRHDNDFYDYNEIRCAPTSEELACRIPPFLPVALYGAPNPLPEATMERLLDMQFRLLREELTAPLRTSIQLVLDDLTEMSRKGNTLASLITKGGGKYRGAGDGQDTVLFNVYTDVNFHPLSPDRRGIAVNISFAAPPGRARSTESKVRASFWEAASGKRLMQGGLVALVWEDIFETRVHLGTVASSGKDIAKTAKESEGRVSVKILFFDQEVELRILRALKSKHGGYEGTKLLVEAPVMYEAIRPFLEALRVEPEDVPFSRYLVNHPPGFFGPTFKIEPPQYASLPDFSFRLESLFPPGSGIRDLRLAVNDEDSVELARRELKRASRLDVSQADAVVDALTRRVALIQGPPGTGKSYTGVELIRALLANGIGPILMIAFTNHALDHMLTSVLDAKITTKICRLGSRSADETISSFSIETMEAVHSKSRLDRSFGRQYRDLKLIEEEIGVLMQKFAKVTVESNEIENFLEFQYPEFKEGLVNPPNWISLVKQAYGAEGWQRIGRDGRAEEQDSTTYGYWKNGEDLLYLEQIKQPKRAAVPPTNKRGNRYESLPKDPLSENEEIDSASKPSAQLFSSLGLKDEDFVDPVSFFFNQGYSKIPTVPQTDRSLEELLSTEEMWQFSMLERERLHSYWTDRILEDQQTTCVSEFEDLRNKHAEALRINNEGRDETRRQLLQNVDIIGCTTTGAAKLTSLLKGISPRIMLVEEAGQVLEAHILGALVPSIEHLILIGDHKQLRPNLNNYSLSAENLRGSGQLYKFDISLMERLASSGMPVSCIDVQRRMRPEISSLIRNTLYPNLEDHDIVKHYPNVHGFASNVFFMDHGNKENGGADDSASKYNAFEVEMIKDLVIYLLRQGCYSEEGDIAVLCAYLGQLARVRDALSEEVAVVIDERDQAALDDQEDGNEQIVDTSSFMVERVKISRRVRLRTVDNYQGEEARIVILSLVRNSGNFGDGELGGRANIGFLRSDNRTNVALSRAKEGLYILGNSQDLSSRSNMWRQIVTELEERECIGPAIPVMCQRHPETIEYISEPGVLQKFAPDGGCLLPCDKRLKCGHACPYKCHSDDPGHLAVYCAQLCRKLCARGHPCSRECSQTCGDCQFPVYEVTLPCGHVKASVPCHLMEKLDVVTCTVLVHKKLPSCEHSSELACSLDPANHSCKAPCGGSMLCCSRNCNAPCHLCQKATKAAEVGTRRNTGRTSHVEHPCQRTLYCEHRCQVSCSENHQCTSICKQACRQECAHNACKDYCSTPCAPCQEPCTWNCPHFSCPVPCGSICTRLPCDNPCEKLLICGHQCPSVCGEDCSIQHCVRCADDNVKGSIVDFIMQRTLSDINPAEGTLDELLITLPKCKHVFTVETLDGHCGMSEFYQRRQADGPWTSLETPPFEYKKPPVCPTCRTAITAPRYGRVFKRADLDILERNVASSMAQQLSKAQNTLDRVDKGVVQANLKTLVQSISVPENEKDSNETYLKLRSDLLDESSDFPVPVETIDPRKRYHDVLPAVSAKWAKAVTPILTVYRQATKIAGTRSAHVNAWSSAFSKLYEGELEKMLSVPSRVPRRPEENALRVAKMLVGQPQPRADKRFVVEAFWLTLDVRFLLVDLAKVWLQQASTVDAYTKEEWAAWASFGSFLLLTCVRDSHTAFRIARESESRRQMTKSILYVMRGELERFRFEYESVRLDGSLKTRREDLINRAAQRLDETEILLKRTRSSYTTTMHPSAEDNWLEENFDIPGSAISAEWRSLSRSLRMETFYEPVSIEEKMNIVRALDFSHTGHFYNCPNGHTFVIGECGGAMQVSACPECGARIGGSGHNLDRSNTRATEFEELARNSGARQSPWAWGV